MSLLALLLTVVLFGIILWVINSFIPMDAKVKQILNIVAIVVLIIWLLKAFGIFAALSTVKI